MRKDGFVTADLGKAELWVSSTRGGHEQHYHCQRYVASQLGGSCEGEQLDSNCSALVSVPLQSFC